MEKLLVGKIVKPQGLDGTVKIKIYTDTFARFKKVNKVLVNEETSYKNFKFIRGFSDFVYAKIEGINNRTDAENARNTSLYIYKQDMYSLDEDEYFVNDLVGMQVLDENNNLLGVIKEVEQYGASDILVIQTLDGEVSVPFIDALVIDIHVKEKTFIVRKEKFDEVSV